MSAVRMSEAAPIRKNFDTRHSQHADRIGESFDVVRRIVAPDAEHDLDALPMYRIRFRDGAEIDAWPDEVEEPSRKKRA